MAFTLCFLAESNQVATQHGMRKPVLRIAVYCQPCIFNRFLESIVIAQELGRQRIEHGIVRAETVDCGALGSQCSLVIIHDSQRRQYRPCRDGLRIDADRLLQHANAFFALIITYQYQSECVQRLAVANIDIQCT